MYHKSQLVHLNIARRNRVNGVALRFSRTTLPQKEKSGPGFVWTSWTGKHTGQALTILDKGHTEQHPKKVLGFQAVPLLLESPF